MKIIGVAGPIASGKSAVSQRLVELGAGLLDADKAGHAVLHQPEVKREIRARWGEAVFNEAGEINRQAVAAIVFQDDPTELQWLEKLSHPRIGKLLENELAAMKAQGRIAAVLDAALLFKAGWNSLCDVVLFVDRPRDACMQQARQRGWTDDQYAAREQLQLPVSEKKKRSDIVLDNSGSLAALIKQVDDFWNSQ